jgi:excinuclease ABC subunit C
MSSFVKQFYDEAAYVPPAILLQHSVDEAMVIEQWLKQKRGTKVALQVPQRGKGRELVKLAAENAADTLANLRAQWAADQARQVTALDDLQKYLHIDTAPTRIECYDISNIQGRAATGSMVVFVKGVPRKSEYRRFQIKSVSGANDYAMLQEVLRRRFKRAAPSARGGAAQEPKPVEEEAGGWAVLPDLLVVDGGKGQLHAAMEVMAEMGVSSIPAIGLAKRMEEVFVPSNPDPVAIPRDSEGLYLLERIRDEAHRFAIGYHRKLRTKAGLSSKLDEIPGIGDKRRAGLMRRFRSLEAIRQASIEELASVTGMTREAAERLKERL